MTKCGCRRLCRSRDDSQVSDVGAHEDGEPPVVLVSAPVAAVVLAPDVGDILGQTIGVSQSEFDKRQSTVRRVFSLRNTDQVALETETLDDSHKVDVSDDLETEEALISDMRKSQKKVEGERNPPLDIITTDTHTVKEEGIKRDSFDTKSDERPAPTGELEKFARQLEMDERKSEVDELAMSNQHLIKNSIDKLDGAERRKSSLERDSRSEAADGPEEVNLNPKDRNHSPHLLPIPADAQTGGSVPISCVAESIIQPLASPDSLPSMRLQFLKSWLGVLESCQKSVREWVKSESLLKAHILGRLIKIDCERAQAVLEGADRNINEIGASTSCILPADGNLPFLESLIPAEVLVEIGGGADILSDVRQNCNEQELEELRTRTSNLVNNCIDINSRNLQEKWNNFGEIMSIFDLNQRISFDIPPVSLMHEEAIDLWNAAISQFGAALTNDPLRVQSAPPSAPVVDTRKGGFRRSLSRGVKKVGRRVKYRKKPRESQTLSEPWVCEEKPQLSLAYRLHKDGNVSVKVRCKLPINFMNMILVLDDVNGFQTWLPYCTEVNLIKRYGTASYLLSYIADMPWPIKKRETLAFCQGIDAFDELGQVIVLVKNPPLSPELNTIFGDPLPPPLAGIPRIPKCALVFFVHPLERNVTGVELFARLDPGVNVKLLKGVIPWMVKNTVVDFMVKIARLAQKIDATRAMSNPDKSKEFYDSLNDRGSHFLEARDRPEVAPAPLSEKQRKALGFDDNDPTWHEKIPVLTM